MTTLKLIKRGLINSSRSELNLRACLKGGMSFRWALDADEFTGVIGEHVFQLKQAPNENTIEYSVFGNEENQCEESIDGLLRDYFRLNDPSCSELYSYWSSRDPKFKEKVEKFSDVLAGIRVLRLDPVENLFSFICSSNNGIPRITQMVANLCIHFGKLIGKLNDKAYYTFPSIESLTENTVEKQLRELKFGYRAKFIRDAAVYLSNREGGGKKWLHTLRLRPYEEVHPELVKIPGVGKKVADCVCLMSLDKLDAIPVDTHVFQMARLYGFVKNDSGTKKGSNSLSDSAYRIIADKFRDLWGKHAGWAQTVMFIDDLREFKLQKAKSSASLDEQGDSKTKRSLSPPTTPKASLKKKPKS